MKKYFRYTALTFAVSLAVAFSLLYNGNALKTSAQPRLFTGGEPEINISLPIIMYHTIFEKNLSNYNIKPAVFEADLKYIKEKGFNTVFVQDLIDFQEMGKPLPEKPIMITFDDGSLTNYLYGYKILKKYGMKAVMAVVGSFVESNYDNEGKLKPNQKAYLNYDHIKEMTESGLIEIQNHSYNLHNLSPRRGLAPKKGEALDAYEKVLGEDLMKTQKNLEDKVSIKCRAVAFPFGSYSKHTIKVIKDMGFKASFTCNEGINRLDRNSDLFLLKRYNRPCNASTKNFFDKIISKI